MNEEISELEVREETHFVPASKWERILYAFVVIVMPIISFAITYDDILNPDWQDGRIASYAGILLGGTASRYFFPFLIYALIAFALLLINPDRFSKTFFVRLGIYTGSILALQYAIIVSAFTDGIAAAIGILGGAAFFFGTRFLYRKIGARKTGLVYIGLLLAVYLIWAIATDFRDAVSVLSFIVAFFFITAPFATLVIGVLTSWKLTRKYPLSQKEYLGLSAWLIGYVVAWQAAILKTMEVYSSLPTHPPCYIATAAAKGHPRLVGSTPLHAEDGQIVHVNAQLRVLKFGEIALAVITPHFHRSLRKGYDIVGKFLARGIVHPTIADVAYLALKPFEWGTRLVLKIFISELDVLVENIYKG